MGPRGGTRYPERPFLTIQFYQALFAAGIESKTAPLPLFGSLSGGTGVRKPSRPSLPPVPQLLHNFREPLHGGVVLATLLPGLPDHVVEEPPRRLLQAVKHDSVFSRDDEECRPGFERERLANRTRNDDLSAGRDAGGKGGSHST